MEGRRPRKYESATASTRDPIMVLFFSRATCENRPAHPRTRCSSSNGRSGFVGSDRGKHVLALESFETRHIDPCPSQISTSSLFISISPPSIVRSIFLIDRILRFPLPFTFIRFSVFSPFSLSQKTEMQMLGWLVGWSVNSFPNVWCTCASHP